METIDWYAVTLSVKVAICTSLVALPVAIVLGYVLARKNFFGKVWVEAMLHLPMVMPPVTTGYLLLVVLGTHGIVGETLYKLWGIRIAFTFSAAVIASIIVSFPLILRSVKVAMEMVDEGLEKASDTLGASPVQTFFYVTLPLAWPGVLGGFVLAFARSLGEFGATVTFAGNIAGETRTLPLAIYAKMQVPGQEGPTFVLVGISIAISLTAIVSSEYFYGRRRLKRRRTLG